MRGGDNRMGELFSYADLEARVRRDHPLQGWRGRVRSIGKSHLNLAPDHQVEFGDDLPRLDQSWYTSFDRSDRDGLRSRKQSARSS